MSSDEVSAVLTKGFYTVTAIDAEGRPLPDVTVEIHQLPGFSWAWYARLPRKLCIDGHEYRRRQAARKKRRR